MLGSRLGALSLPSNEAHISVLQVRSSLACEYVRVRRLGWRKLEEEELDRGQLKGASSRGGQVEEAANERDASCSR